MVEFGNLTGRPAMGDKSGKRRPGREAERLTPPPRVLVVRVGEFWVSVDTRTGMIECPMTDELTPP